MFIGIVVFTGCAYKQPMIFEGTDQVYNHCIRQFQIGYIRSKTDHVQCVNDGFERLIIVNNYPHRDLFDLQASYRLTLAGQVDRNEIDIEDAEDRMADLSNMIADEEHRRSNTTDYRIAELINEINDMSATAAGPVWCQRIAQKVECKEP